MLILFLIFVQITLNQILKIFDFLLVSFFHLFHLISKQELFFLKLIKSQFHLLFTLYMHSQILFIILQFFLIIWRNFKICWWFYFRRKRLIWLNKNNWWIIFFILKLRAVFFIFTFDKTFKWLCLNANDLIFLFKIYFYTFIFKRFLFQ